MEKQLLIKHACNNFDEILTDIIQYLNVIFSSDSCAVCKFNLYKGQDHLLEELKKFHNLKVTTIKPNCRFALHQKCTAVELSGSCGDIKALLPMVIKNELNIVIFCESIKVILNDNDGDFVVVDAKNPKYRTLKSLHKVQKTENRSES